MHPLLEVKNLEINFKQDGIQAKAVNGISFTVAKGKITALVGESGSGKSVTALSILQLLSKNAIQSGEIIFTPGNGGQQKLTQLSEKSINKIRGNKIAMVFQEPMSSLNPVFTCGRQVMEVLRKHKSISKAEAKTTAIGLFEQVELPNPAAMVDRYPHQLSGGQKQRVMIAMAMSCQPDLLIADEPTTALDVRVQRNILKLIKDLQKKNEMGVLFITHDLGLVAEIADELLVMYKGSIVEKGNAAFILKNPAHHYTKALLACRPTAIDKGKKLAVIEDYGKESTRKELGIHQLLSPKTILSVQKLKVYFPATKNFFGKPISFFKAVDNVNLEIQEGEIAGLVGESGCGKTTLGRAILKLIEPTSGEIILNGRSLNTMQEKQLRAYRKDFQIVFQDPYGSLNPRISIGKAINEVLTVHNIHHTRKDRKEAVLDMLEKVQLSPDHYNRYPHQFSGGQRQRICIARALVLNPSFLLFDESVSALDLSVQASILNLINELRSIYKFTAIFISHDLSVVHYICDTIHVMRKGKIIESGSAHDIYFNPQNKYTQQLIEAIPGKSLR